MSNKTSILTMATALVAISNHAQASSLERLHTTSDSHSQDAPETINMFEA